MSDKKAQLERAAIDSVQRNGLKDLSFRTLASEVGIKSASVHYHFPGKADLANSLIEKYSDEFGLLLKTIDSDQHGLKSKLDNFIDIFENVLKDGKLCLCGIMAAEVERLDAQSRELLERYFELSEVWLAIVLEAERDKLATDLTSKKLAKIILSGLEGAILLDRVDGGFTRLEAQRDLIHSFLQ